LRNIDSIRKHNVASNILSLYLKHTGSRKINVLIFFTTKTNLLASIKFDFIFHWFLIKKKHILVVDGGPKYF